MCSPCVLHRADTQVCPYDGEEIVLILRLCGLAAAFFVFFAAAAGAGVVPADFGLIELDLLDLLFALRGGCGGPLSLAHLKLADFLLLRLADVIHAAALLTGLQALRKTMSVTRSSMVSSISLNIRKPSCLYSILGSFSA